MMTLARVRSGCLIGWQLKLCFLSIDQIRRTAVSVRLGVDPALCKQTLEGRVIAQAGKQVEGA